MTANLYPVLADTVDDVLDHHINDLHDDLSQRAFNVKRYGAIGDGNADDTAEIQAAIDDAEVVGGIVYFPIGVYKLTAALTVNSPAVHIKGASHWFSIIKQTANNLAGINVDTDHCHIENIRMQYGGAGAAINGSVGIKLTSGVGHYVNNVYFTESWYRNLETVDAYQWTIKRCMFANAVLEDCHFQSVANPDTGDNFFEHNHCTTSTGTTYALHWESGGGMHVINNKLIGHATEVYLAPVAGVVTQNWLFSGNSLENYTDYGVRAVRAAGVPTFGFVKISDNEFDSAAGTVAAIQMNAGFPMAEISDNVIRMQAGTGIGIDIEGGDAHVSDNTIIGAATGLKVADLYYVDYSDNLYQGCTVNVEDSAGQDAIYGPSQHYYQGHLEQTGSTVTYKYVFEIEMKAYRAIEVKIVCDFLISAVGKSHRIVRKLVGLGDINTACVVTALEDVAVGTAFDLSWDTATNNKVRIGVKKSAGAQVIFGQMHLVITGSPYRVKHLVPNA